MTPCLNGHWPIYNSYNNYYYTSTAESTGTDPTFYKPISCITNICTSINSLHIQLKQPLTMFHSLSQQPTLKVSYSLIRHRHIYHFINTRKSLNSFLNNKNINQKKKQKKNARCNASISLRRTTILLLFQRSVSFIYVS